MDRGLDAPLLISVLHFERGKGTQGGKYLAHMDTVCSGEKGS